MSTVFGHAYPAFSHPIWFSTLHSLGLRFLLRLPLNSNIMILRMDLALPHRQFCPRNLS